MRPGSVDTAVQNDIADSPSPKLLRDRWEMQNRIDLALGQETHRIGGRLLNQIDVPTRVKTELKQDHREKEMVRRPRPRDRDRLALEVPDRLDALRPKQLEASDVRAGEHDDRVPGVDTRDQRRDERDGHVGLAGGQRLQTPGERALPELLDAGE